MISPSSSSSSSSSTAASSLHAVRKLSPSTMAARDHRLPHGSSVTAGPTVRPPSSVAAAFQPRLLRSVFNSEPSPFLKPHGLSIKAPSTVTAGTKPEQTDLVEEDEIRRLGEIPQQGECRPDSVYLVRLLESQEHVCKGPEPSPFCITHRR